MALARNILPVYPEVAVTRPPEPERCIIEIYGLPDQWSTVGVEVFYVGHKTEYALYEGAVYPRILFGERDFKNPQAGTEFKAALPTAVYRSWLALWEAETGLCHECRGSGLACAGWSKETGKQYRSCTRCGATGKAPAGERVAS